MKTMLQIPVLLSIARLDKEAYGMAIVEDIKETYGREISIGAVYITLKRLQKDGLVRSKTGEITKKRGGRRKTIYHVQSSGRHYLRDYYHSVTTVWKDLEHYLAEHRFL